MSVPEEGYFEKFGCYPEDEARLYCIECDWFDDCPHEHTPIKVLNEDINNGNE